jgi:predicted KAP-like P-loop ATPase
LSDKFKNDLQELAASLDTAARSAGLKAEVVGLTSTLTPDEPIRSSAQDRLNRSGFATELARAIISLARAESVVIGIHGKWGTGKTSLLNLIEEKLQKVSPEPPIIFRFNPWGFSDQEQLIAQFFDGMSEFLKLHKTITPLSGVSDTVEEYGRLLSPLARMAFPRVAESMKVGWQLFRRVKPARRSAAELKAQISASLVRSRLRLIIIIDDIDRLNAAEIRQSFQLIKINGNFSNTVYLVAFDTKAVESALESVAPGPAREYLEKIVQVAFNLPPISQSTLSEMIVGNFNEMIADLTIDTQRFGNMLHSGFLESFQTIRDVNRYFNLFRFAFNLIRDDTNFIDLAAIQALALFYPNVYHSIERNPELFTDSWDPADRPDQKSLEQKYGEILGGAPSGRQNSAVSLCRFLFPKLEYVVGPSHTFWGRDWIREWEKEKRVCTSKYFSYYFELAVPETDVSQAELDKALDSAHSLDAFIATLEVFMRSKRFGAFVDLLRNSLEKLDRQRMLIILESIFVFGDRVSSEGSSMFFGVISDHVRFGIWLFYDLLDRLGKDRFDYVIRFMANRPAVFTITNVAAMCDQIVSDKTNPNREKQREKYPELTTVVVEQMKAAAVEAISNAARDGRLRSVQPLLFVLSRWREWDNPDRVTEWVAMTFLQDPKTALELVARFAHPVTSMSVSDKVPRVRIVVPIKSIREFVDLEALTALVKGSKDNELTAEEKVAKDHFLGAKAKFDSGIDPESPTAIMDED